MEPLFRGHEDEDAGEDDAGGCTRGLWATVASFHSGYTCDFDPSRGLGWDDCNRQW